MLTTTLLTDLLPISQIAKVIAIQEALSQRFLFDRGQQERDPQRRFEFFAKAEDILIQEAPVIPILRESHCSLRKGYLSLINHGSLKSWDFKWASINNKERYL